MDVVFDLLWYTVRAVQSLKRRSRLITRLGMRNKRINSTPEYIRGETLVSSEDFRFDDQVAGTTTQIFFESRRVCTRDEAIVDLQSGIVLNEEKEIIPDSSPWGIEHLMQSRLPSRAFPKTLIPKYTKDVEVLKLASQGYYHFLVEELPSLLHLLKRFTDKTILISDKSPKYLLDCVSELKLRCAIVKSLVRVEKIIYLSHQPITGWPNPRDISILREKFGYLRRIDNSLRVKVYVSRRNSSRSPAFEYQLEDLLSRKGWKVIQAERMNFRDQVEMFSSASVVMGVHGAGLANAVWMIEGSKLIELIPNDRPLCYERMAQILGLNHRRIFLETARNKSENRIPIKVLEILDEL